MISSSAHDRSSSAVTRSAARYTARSIASPSQAVGSTSARGSAGIGLGPRAVRNSLSERETGRSGSKVILPWLVSYQTFRCFAPGWPEKRADESVHQAGDRVFVGDDSHR